ncbi:MAG TPA: SCO family protein [Gaiellaceae bacterium]|nr:SCO family protein [Gaiellaceae bacterium]
MRNAAAGAVLLAVLVLAGCGGSSTPKISGPATTTAQVGGAILQAKPLAPQISLHDDRGRAISLSDFRGKWVAVAFIYTHCPDVCPLIAQNLNQALAKAPDLRVVAVSVDPKGDTPAAVRAFIRSHHLTTAFHYLIGSRVQLSPVWRAWHVAAVPGPAKTVSHSSFEVLVDPAGHERAYYDATVTAADVLHDLKQLHGTV